ncbi:hypothetical protein Q9S36_29000 [Microbacterium sp. ARD31]|uniref:hypothetical protein n=1 Tax=Microbacterium sp. ARD31 TaxID=2962576 RepID=UPI002881FE86|nr:hypothetical protein [Microbacterium sp. ARD31]MDT0184239.1 hypothetical protein [Microbacterium sp. ARD31]
MLSQDHEGIGNDVDERHEGDAAGRVAVPGPRSPSAARLLEMTARETDQWRTDARAEAAEVVAAAREESDALVRSAQREAHDLVETARREAERIVGEARATAEEVQVASDRRRTEAEAEVARLQQVAADHSDSLRQHLNDVLDRLDGVPPRQGLRRRDDS